MYASILFVVMVMMIVESRKTAIYLEFCCRRRCLLTSLTLDVAALNVGGGCQVTAIRWAEAQKSLVFARPASEIRISEDL